MFRELVRREEADQSPIVETMADLVQRDDELDSIVLVSDMLQNTSLWSSYARAAQSGDATGISSECGRITSPGRLKAVYVYYIDREHVEMQPPEWPDAWWERCLRGAKTEMLN